MMIYVQPLPLPTTQATARLPYVASVADFWCTQLARDQEVEYASCTLHQRPPVIGDVVERRRREAASRIKAKRNIAVYVHHRVFLQHAASETKSNGRSP